MAMPEGRLPMSSSAQQSGDRTSPTRRSILIAPFVVAALIQATICLAEDAEPAADGRSARLSTTAIPGIDEANLVRIYDLRVVERA